MLERLKKNLINIPGKRLDKKYLVFESDDWGTIRTPDRAVFDELVAKKLISPNDPFSRYDTLESEQDLASLFEVLDKYRDINSNPAVITANTVVCNPDFEKIKASGFTQYKHEPFTTTYDKYPGSRNAFKILKEGIDNGYYYPQFHAREHLNLSMWMELLRQEDVNFRYAFDLNCFSIDYKDSSNRRGNVMAAYDYYSPTSLETVRESIKEGLKIFENIFSFKSLSTVAPCYVWDNEVEKTMEQNGVKFLQGSKFQHIPSGNSAKFQKKFHFNGETNDKDQQYFSRNGLFEPSINTNINWVNKCLESIDIAFKWKKPAIVGTHRLNFCGSIFPENRDKNLKLTEELLKAVLKKWPDVEFVSTVGLAEAYADR